MKRLVLLLSGIIVMTFALATTSPATAQTNGSCPSGTSTAAGATTAASDYPPTTEATTTTTSTPAPPPSAGVCVSGTVETPAGGASVSAYVLGETITRGSLPRTGMDHLIDLLRAAALLIVVGASLVYLRRRRKARIPATA